MLGRRCGSTRAERDLASFGELTWPLASCRDIAARTPERET
jgi:hypothetical protein